MFFITGNNSKFKEAKEILAKEGIQLKQKEITLIEPKTLDQEEIVLAKAHQAFQKIKQPVLVDDTCILFNAYNNFPGTFTKYVFQSLGFLGVQQLLEKCSREATFQTLLCYKDKNNTKIFKGNWKGKIISEISEKFNPDWQYNSIFIPEGFNMPLSEIPLNMRAKQSHRKKAFDELIKWRKENEAY